ncbi:LOW QUALITY PROTEIN: uncharacterized protein KNAG_0G00960 [Huiozyma naganishii CBS 8797]|uniref:Reverse transcriptase Ty1/copia-type domain-containing protein n=1 Tax=Huiozyma naganishii (strain ATCC MYA-139 / BCRC 22969 / CBS 8797 / KCTC 17520 / NBRC 10181 / NCYC 3082 / Yp74L-3) TaxID=1071383 RepID=J7S0T6_HUIN7|nr:LOW QUALITY PROTEIN: hypothetical protein KNAG_0G00960 [Kazachstania naganishii CBS 8797]CCK71152.1 hypothetical protein KNAG_0G00960 [Kazachstania naganishii CBS 8797]
MSSVSNSPSSSVHRTDPDYVPDSATSSTSCITTKGVPTGDGPFSQQMLPTSREKTVHIIEQTLPETPLGSPVVSSPSTSAFVTPAIPSAPPLLTQENARAMIRDAVREEQALIAPPAPVPVTGIQHGVPSTPIGPLPVSPVYSGALNSVVHSSPFVQMPGSSPYVPPIPPNFPLLESAIPQSVPTQPLIGGPQGLVVAPFHNYGTHFYPPSLAHVPQAYTTPVGVSPSPPVHSSQSMNNSHASAASSSDATNAEHSSAGLHAESLPSSSPPGSAPLNGSQSPCLSELTYSSPSLNRFPLSETPTPSALPSVTSASSSSAVQSFPSVASKASTGPLTSSSAHSDVELVGKRVYNDVSPLHGVYPTQSNTARLQRRVQVSPSFKRTHVTPLDHDPSSATSPSELPNVTQREEPAETEFADASDFLFENGDSDSTGFMSLKGAKYSAPDESNMFAVGDSTIPAYSIDGTVVPYGDTTDHYCYMLTGGNAATRENPLTTALSAQARLNEFPRTYKEAMGSTDHELWSAACKREMDSLVRTKPFEEIRLPPGRKAIPARWVLSIKDSGLYKARVVVQGFRQTEGLDYDETFAPVIRYESVRLFLAIFACQGVKVHQMDVVTAFLNSPIDKELFVKPPVSYKSTGDSVWKLRSALYGLKQSPLLWNEHIKGKLLTQGFTQHPSEFGLYFRRRAGKLCLIALYVDDLLISSQSDAEIAAIKRFLLSTYEMKDLGEVNKFLGMSVAQTKGKITLSLCDYITKKVTELGLTNFHPTHTPLQKHVDYYGESPCSMTAYQSLIGTLLFVANSGRPDVAHSVSFLSRFLKDSREVHYNAAKRIMAYLHTTKNQEITYHNNGKPYLEIFTDASYADCSNGQSTYGYMAKYGGGPVSWCSKRIPCVVVSTTEAFVAANESVKEILWLDEILGILGIPKERHILYVNNAPTIKMLKHPVFHSRTKHIRVRYHFIRQNLSEKLLKTEYANTRNQIADICTKMLEGPEFQYLKTLIFGRDSNSET